MSDWYRHMLTRDYLMANWPTHARKRALKRTNRRRTIAELAKEQLNREKTYGVRA